jgi:archaellin
VKQLVIVAGGLCLLGVLVSPVAAYVLIAAGALGMRTEALTGRTGRAALAMGLATLGWQLITDALGSPSPTGMIAALVCAVLFFAGAVRSR